MQVQYGRARSNITKKKKKCSTDSEGKTCFRAVVHLFLIPEEIKWPRYIDMAYTN